MPPRGFYRDQAGGMGGGKYERAGGHESFVDMGGIFSEMFGQRGGRGGGGFNFRGGDGEGFDMGGMPVTYSLRVPFLVAARGGKQRVNLPDGKTLDIDVPEGTTDGQTLRLKGQGMPGAKGRPAGDAYVEIHVDPHPFFEPRDNDIHVELPVTLTEAVLGGKIKVPTVGGPVMLNVPAGSNTGTSLRLKGRGLLDRKSGQRGDQYVKLKVVLPEQARRQAEGVPGEVGGGQGLRPAQGDGAVHMTSLDELLRVHGRLTTVHVERWVARGLLRPTAEGDAWGFEPVDVARARLLAELVDESASTTRRSRR